MTVEQKRLVISAVIDRVEVQPGRPGPRRHKGLREIAEDRIDIVWRQAS